MQYGSDSPTQQQLEQGKQPLGGAIGEADSLSQSHEGHSERPLRETMSQEGSSPNGRTSEMNAGQNQQSPGNFFAMSGMPKFGKQWLNNFIADSELQNAFVTSEVVRNMVMLQCLFYASVYNDLMIYKHAFLEKEGPGREGSRQDNNHDAKSASSHGFKSGRQSAEGLQDVPPYKIGIIGCGQVGTMILTKLIEISSSFHNLQIMVSTRQPHLLRPFKDEFGIQAEFNNDKVFAECDLIFLCVLPSQAESVLKEVRYVMEQRLDMAKKDAKCSQPLVMSCMAAMGKKKLKLLLSDEATFVRTNIDVTLISRYLKETSNQVPNQVVHPSKQAVATPGGEFQNQYLDANGKPKTPGSAMPGSKNQSDPRLNKCLSGKAVSLGLECGVTAEFIIHQTSEQLMLTMEDMFIMLDAFQHTLYSNDPVMVEKEGTGAGNSAAGRKSAGGSKGGAEGQQRAASAQSAPKKDYYEESILMTLLGADYQQFISGETGEWANQAEVRAKFQELFEARIRILFDAELN